MKKIKIIAAVLLAACTAVSVSAQTAALHGYMDYTTFVIGQQFTKAGTADFEASDAAAEFGSFYNGRTELNCVVEAANFQFNVGVRMDASLGTWYDLYHATSGSAGVTEDTPATFFHQGNMRVGFFNDQLRVYAGKFEEWNAGYVLGGYVLGGMNIRNFADRDNGQHFTGIEIAPYAVNGLKVMIGFPITPVSGNGVNYAEQNTYPGILLKVKGALSYKLPVGVTLIAGYRNETHYEGTANYSADSYFKEAWLQADMPNLIPGFAMNASYDFRYREDNGAMMHFAGVSGKFSPADKLTVSVEDRFAYAADHYIAVNEEMLYNVLGVAVTYQLPKTYSIGFNCNFAYAQDAEGSAFASSRINSKYCDDFAMVSEWMPAAAAPAAGSAGTYIGVYAYPYFQKGFANGYMRTGIEIQYTNFSTSVTNQAIGYRVPVALCFWF